MVEVLSKNKQIKQTLLQTRGRRKSQVCKVFEIKFDKSHLSKEKLYHLKMLFVEAKWLYNYQLSLEDSFSLSDKQKEIEVLNKEKQKERRKIEYLSSQMKQVLVSRLRQNILNLSKKKKKGQKVGRLKFKSQIYSIPLTQFGITYQIKNKDYVSVQGFGRKYFKVLGLSQIPENAEIANANLIQRNGEYYFQLTIFLPKEEKIKTGKVIGLDFGIKDNVVDSNGNRYNFQFPEPKQLKKTQRELGRKKKGSNNRYKQKLILQKQYEKLTNKKKDAKNKFIAKLVKENDLIVIQDESIAGWKSSGFFGFGRKIQHSIIGGIISDLKRKSETLVIDRFFPSTQLCPSCGNLNKFGLEWRIYSCTCGYFEDRDIHAARNILNEGLKQLSMEYRNTMPVEKKSSESILDLRYASAKQEACGFDHR